MTQTGRLLALSIHVKMTLGGGNGLLEVLPNHEGCAKPSHIKCVEEGGVR